MILKSIRSRQYKNIRDSGEVRIEDDVTCLVGKNESGKTALLQSLYRLNPLATGHPETFVGLRDYPRRHYSRDRERVPATRPITATFELDDEDVETVESLFGAGVLGSRLVTVEKTYENRLVWEIDYDEERHVRSALEEAGLDGAAGTGFDTWEELSSTLHSGEDCPEDALLFLHEHADRDFRSEIQAVIERRLPKFLYFDEYSMMRGRISISRLRNSDERTLEPGERTALSFMRLAGVDAAEFTGGEFEARRASLEAAANQLTDEVFEYWSQNPDLSVELDVDFDGRGDDDAESPFIDVRIRNQRHRITLNFDERSQGFTWFFSFLTAFSEFKRRERMILLLDEPGLGLHGAAQGDLLRFIDERLAPSHQVVYSTHSPFMVASKSLQRVRMVEDMDGEGTRVKGHDFAENSEDTRLPLEVALGHELARSLVVEPDGLLVEGPADHVFLTAMSSHLEKQGRSYLDPRWTIVPTGGLARVPAFVALLEDRADVALVAGVAGVAGGSGSGGGNGSDGGSDGDGGGGGENDSPPGRGSAAGEGNVVRPADFAGGEEAGIEDLFAEDFYVDLVNRSGAATVEWFEVHGRKDGGIAQRIEAATGAGFNRYLPARHLVEHHAELSDRLDGETLDRFEALFRRINRLLA